MIEKMRAAGKEVPPSMQAMADALDKFSAADADGMVRLSQRLQQSQSRHKTATEDVCELARRSVRPMRTAGASCSSVSLLPRRHDCTQLASCSPRHLSRP